MVRFCIYGARVGFLLAILIFPSLSFSADILFHEANIGYDKQESTMFSVNEDGSELVSIGDGVFPQRSPDKKYFSCIKLAHDNFGCGVYGDLIIKDEKSDKIIPTLYFSEVDCNVVQCPPQPTKDQTLKMHHCTITSCWNPDSERLAFATVLGLSLRDGFIYVVDTKTRETQRVHHFKYRDFTHVPWGTTLEWSPDGNLLLFNTFSIGPEYKNGTDIMLIDLKTLSAKKIDTGCRPRFVDNKRIISVIGTSIWIKNIDTDEKNKLCDMPCNVASVSEVKENKVLLQTSSEKEAGVGSIKLYCLDIDKNKLEPIEAEKYVFYCPKLSPDGKKMTAFGINFAEKEKAMGYYVYNLQTKQAKLLKALNVANIEENRGLWLGLFFGYGNHATWN